VVFGLKLGIYSVFNKNNEIFLTCYSCIIIIFTIFRIKNKI
jgi:hypothetical protein